MAEQHPIEALVVEALGADARSPDGETRAIVPYRPPTLSVTPEATAADLVARLAVIRGAMQQAMEKDVDYGVIPGTGTKPTLLKPGAEKLGALFQLDVQIANEKIWHEDGHLTVISHAVVYHQPTGARLGGGEGICTTREAKYAWRKAERVCPTCGKPAIIKGRDEYGGGWLCWTKKDGCGAKFADNDPAIIGQQTDRVPNPDLADAYNTVDKMASKRARIDAVLAVTGASALFTQDVEDMPRDDGESIAERPQERRSDAADYSGKQEAGSQHDKDQKAAHAIKRKLIEAGLTQEQFEAGLVADFGTGHINELTAEQCHTLVAKLREAEKAIAKEKS